MLESSGDEGVTAPYSSCAGNASLSYSCSLPGTSVWRRCQVPFLPVIVGKKCQCLAQQSIVACVVCRAPCGAVCVCAPCVVLLVACDGACDLHKNTPHDFEAFLSMKPSQSYFYAYQLKRVLCCCCNERRPGVKTESLHAISCDGPEPVCCQQSVSCRR